MRSAISTLEILDFLQESESDPLDIVGIRNDLDGKTALKADLRGNLRVILH